MRPKARADCTADREFHPALKTFIHLWRYYSPTAVCLSRPCGGFLLDGRWQAVPGNIFALRKRRDALYCSLSALTQASHLSHKEYIAL